MGLYSKYLINKGIPEDFWGTWVILIYKKEDIGSLNL